MTLPPKTPTTYADVGVNVDAIRESQRWIAARLEQTFSSRHHRIGEVLSPIGHYAGLVKVSDSLVMGTHCDGVGTKVLVAQRAHKYDTVGIDCVAMNVNDLICLGLEPTTLTDYLALEAHQPDLVKAITEGLAQGADQAHIAITGGETAIMGTIIQGDRPGYGFDLAGFVCGFAPPSQIINGDAIRPGDHIIGMASSGFHSNGYTLLRRILFDQERLSSGDPFPGHNDPVSQILLTPTRIYVDPIMALLHDQVPIHGIAHITGGAFGKLPRLTGHRCGFRITRFPAIPSVFTTIQSLAGLTNRDLFTTFNCGIGLVLVTPSDSVPLVEAVGADNHLPVYDLGVISERPGVQIQLERETIQL